MARGIGAFLFISCAVLLVPLGCREPIGQESEPKLFVELNGREAHYGMRPAFYIISGGGAYGLGMSETRMVDGVEYRGRWLYNANLRDEPRPEDLLIGVYGRAEPGTERLAELVIETNVKTKIVLKNCAAWSVRLRRNNRVITGEHWFEPGKHEIEITPQETKPQEQRPG